VVELKKNGHDVVTGPADVVLSANVEEFWLDTVGRAATTQYVGRVAIAVAIADGQSGDALMTRRYVGIRRRSGEADSKETWRDVMETALARTIHDVATDPDLALNIGRAPRRSRTTRAGPLTRSTSSPIIRSLRVRNAL
jgi:hypothetical protein